MNLATITLYNTLLGDKTPNTDSSFLAAISARIASVSAKVLRVLNRKIQQDTYIEKFPAELGKCGTKSVQLSAYPVVSITSVKTYDSALVEGSDFVVDYESGIVSFMIPVLRLYDKWQDAIVIEYEGGMAEDTADFISKYPDIATEVCMQVMFEFARQKNLPNKSTASGAGIVTSHNPYGLQDGLMETLHPYILPLGAI
jgi:hypothetical protein